MQVCYAGMLCRYVVQVCGLCRYVGYAGRCKL